MRIAYLIKTKADKAELVTHGASAEVKKTFLSAPLAKDETLLMLGQDIRPKRRGGHQDINEYLNIVARENEQMKKAREQPKPAAPPKAEPKKADEGKSTEVLKIKKEQNAKTK